MPGKTCQGVLDGPERNRQPLADFKQGNHNANSQVWWLLAAEWIKRMEGNRNGGGRTTVFQRLGDLEESWKREESFMNNRSAPEKKRWLHWILKINPLAFKFSTESTVHRESCLLNRRAPGKGRGPETDTNNNAKSFMLPLFNYNESTHHGNNNNDVFE